MSTVFEIGHDRCRSKVCVVCYGKASCLLSELEIETVEKILIDGYSSSHPDFPCGVCTGCSIATCVCVCVCVCVCGWVCV